MHENRKHHVIRCSSCDMLFIGSSGIYTVCNHCFSLFALSKTKKLFYSYDYKKARAYLIETRKKEIAEYIKEKGI